MKLLEHVHKKDESNICSNGKQKHFNITKSYTFSLYENNTKGISLLNLWNGHICNELNLKPLSEEIQLCVQCCEKYIKGHTK
jgi:hypothetical protein